MSSRELIFTFVAIKTFLLCEYSSRENDKWETEEFSCVGLIVGDQGEEWMVSRITNQVLFWDLNPTN